MKCWVDAQHELARWMWRWMWRAPTSRHTVALCDVCLVKWFDNSVQSPALRALVIEPIQPWFALTEDSRNPHR